MTPAYFPLQRLSLPMAVVCLLGGCLGATRVPEDHFYKLPAVAAGTCHGLSRETIAVAPLQSFSLHGERALLYIDADKPLEINRYHYHHWMESPSRLIQQHLIDYLQSCTREKNVIAYAAGERYDALVQGKILNLERLIHPGDTEVAVAVELVFQARNRRFRGTYRTVKKVNAPGVHASVHAMGLALEELYARFIDEMQVHVSQNPRP